VTTRRNGTTICYSIAPGQLARLGARLTVIAASATAVTDEAPAAPGSP
jgi:hypothetical protein